MAVYEERISEAAATLLDCACVALEDDCPDAVYLTAGPPAWDNCCEGDTGGQLTAHLVETFPYQPWPTRVTPLDPCKGSEWAAVFTVALVKCHPAVDGNGVPPDPDVLDAAARDVNRWTALMRKALQCCPDFRVSVTGSQVQLAPNGGCVGIGFRVIVDLADRTLREGS